MRRFIPVMILCMFLTGIAKGQVASITGKLVDQADRTVISNATVQLMNLKDSSIQQTKETDNTGIFLFNNLDSGIYQLNISYVGYNDLLQRITVNDSSVDLGELSIVKISKQLEDVTVTAKIPPVQQKGDTVQFSASQYKVNPDANAEDLIKKMPGITVDKTGTVTAQGDQVKKVTVDGRDFFGDDATAALRNLPSEVIDKIQVFDKLSDQAAFTGFDDGNSVKAINIVTKTNMRNGQFGRVYAGYGSDGRYSLGGNLSFFKNDRRISLIGMMNNINQQNFSSQDILGVTGSGGGKGGFGGGGGRGGGGRGGGGNSGNFLVGQQSGISTTNSFGINYSDLWGKKVTVTGSYFFNNSNLDNDQISNTQYFISADSSQFNTDSTITNSKNYNHRVNLRIEYKIDSFNSLLITPVVSFQKNQSFTGVNGFNYVDGGAAISASNSSITSNTSGYNLNNNILFRHAFAKKGRTFSINLGTAYNNKTGGSFLESFNKYYQSNDVDDSVRQFTDLAVKGYQLSANFVYTEPIGKQSQLQFNYAPSYSDNKSDQEVNHYDYVVDKYADFDSSLSNKFDNTVTSQNTGLTYRLGNKDNNFSAGVSYQNTKLHSDETFPFTTTVDKTFNNILPNLMWRKKLSAKSSFRLFYRASTTAPSISQLQNVINNSNPLFLTTGNPDLKQQTGNTLSARYIYTNTNKGESFFANIFLQQNDNYIGNASYIAAKDSFLTNTVTLFKGSQLSKPVNLDGYVNLRSFFTYGFPVKFISSNLNVNAGFSWVKTPGIVNNINGISNTYTYNTGAVIASNISEYVDFNLSYTANFNVVKNTLQPALSNNYINQTAGVQLNLLSKSGWFINNDVSNSSYTGLTSGFNQSYWLWNIAAGKKFLKNQNGELRLSVFDLLNQNKNITRTVTETYIEDVQNKVLQQYFMLTFSYKLRNFGTPAKQPVGNNNGGGRFRGQGGNIPSF